MKVNYNYVILILILGLIIYILNVNKIMEHFDSKCTEAQILKAYTSSVFKPRRPEQMDCTTKLDAQGTSKTTCTNKRYCLEKGAGNICNRHNDGDILNNLRVKDVPDECILELVKTWNW
jgi:hypothetical protein